MTQQTKGARVTRRDLLMAAASAAAMAAVAAAAKGHTYAPPAPNSTVDDSKMVDSSSTRDFVLYL